MTMQLVDTPYTLEMPRGRGVEAVLDVLREIFKIGKIVSVQVANGQIQYVRRQAQTDDEDMRAAAEAFPPQLLAGQSPVSVIRAIAEMTEVEEVIYPDMLLSTALYVFGRASILQLAPLCWITGQRTLLWEMLRSIEHSTGVDLGVGDSTKFYGAPVLVDSGVESDGLIFVAGTSLGERLNAARCAWKLTLGKK